MLKRKALVGRDAEENFRKRPKLKEDLNSLIIQDAQIRLDGRIFTLRFLQELRLENVGLNTERNLNLLRQLCRLSDLKTLSLANNQLPEIPDAVFNAIPDGLRHIVLSGNQLVELPRQLMRFRSLVTLDVSNNKLEHVHEDICLLRYLKNLKLQNNNLKNLPFSLIYGRRYQDLNLSDNLELFVEPKKDQSAAVGKKKVVPNLKYITLASAFNLSEQFERLLPEHIKSERDYFLHRCFMCHRYIPFHGTDHVKNGRFDVRDCSEQVSYDQSQVLINYVAHVCIPCRPKAVRFKVFQ